MFGTAHPLGIIAILVIAVLVFGGRGKISGILGDMGKGINAFRKGLKDGGKEEAADVDPAEDAIDVTPKSKKD
jgi:sec-independent protein translocase protein TatA